MTVDNGVDGRVVIVTGGSKGVGRGIALHLARNGATLVITARRAEALEETAVELDALGAPHLATTLDVADRDGAFGLVEQTLAQFGRVDGLVANAQTFRSVTPFADITERDMDLLLSTGPKGTLWGMQAVFPHMRDQRRGRIVTMGSNAALLGAVGYTPYASSKEAIRALHAFGGARVGEVRHHRELPVPGLGRAPRATRRRGSRAGAHVRRDLRQPAHPTRRRRRRRHRSRGAVPPVRRQSLHDRPDADGRRRRHHARLTAMLI